MVTSFPSIVAGVARHAGMTKKPALLPRIALGDAAAVGECLERYGRLVYAFARRYSRDESDIEDACQEIFLALWKNAAAYDPSRAEESTFVALVAKRRLIDRQRAPATRSLPVVDPDLEVRGAQLEAHLDAKNAVAALASCSAEQRKVILLSVMEGLTYEEISRELAMPVGTVKSHYSRGIERVKRALASSEVDQ